MLKHFKRALKATVLPLMAALFMMPTAVGAATLDGCTLTTYSKSSELSVCGFWVNCLSGEMGGKMFHIFMAGDPQNIERCTKAESLMGKKVNVTYHISDSFNIADSVVKKPFGITNFR